MKKAIALTTMTVLLAALVCGVAWAGELTRHVLPLPVALHRPAPPLRMATCALLHGRHDHL